MAGNLRTGVRKQGEVCKCFMGKCIKLEKKTLQRSKILLKLREYRPYSLGKEKKNPSVTRGKVFRIKDEMFPATMEPLN